MPTTYFLDVLTKHYFDFSGEATRTQYWLFVLYACIILACIYMFNAPNYVEDIFLLLLAIPSLAISVRRIRDIGLSGWWILIYLVPFVGGLVFFIFTLLPTGYFGSLARKL